MKKIYTAVEKDKNKIIGKIKVIKTGDQTVQLKEFFVEPDYRRQGIGGRLMEKAEKYFTGVKKLRVECEKKNNQACAFYLKKGFRIVGQKNQIVEFEKNI